MIKSEDELFALATSFVRNIRHTTYTLQGTNRATVVGLTGELGAGKTTFVKGVARELGVREMVTSPTFVIMKIYKLVRQPWKHIVHIDAYRLESADELRPLGWDEIVADSGNLILIEWAEKVRALLPHGHYNISFECVGEHERRVLL